jgi:S1-C subfamily serine protease
MFAALMCSAIAGSDFEGVSFIKTNGLRAGLLSYAELQQARNTLIAYGSAVDRVSKYKEPVATRGTTGMSVFRTAAPSVTLVVVYRNNQGTLDPEGLGTGVVVDSSGYVLTNWHVVGDHSAAVVFFKPPATAEINGDYAYLGEVVYRNPTADLALLKLTRPPANLTALKVADIGNVQVAEDIHVIGHPHGNLWSYSTGVISQIRNDYTWSYSDGSRHSARVLQMQTAINPGNSGGPVLDDESRILGLVAMSEEGQNLDYAIAADVLQRFLLQGYAVRTRGSQQSNSTESVKADAYVGQTSQGEEVTKIVYPDFSVFWVKTNGKIKRMTLLDTGGNRVVATADESGNLHNWEAVMTNGRIVRGQGSANAPEVLTTGP